jgi:flagellar biosynthetic protein FlhB
MARNDSKTEKPTTRRLQKARQKGQVARSKEVPAAAVLLGGLLVVNYLGAGIFQGLKDQLIEFLNLTPPRDLSFSYVRDLARTSLWRLTLLIMPTLFSVCILAVGANLIQTRGLVISWHQLGFHIEKLKPKNGFSRIFSKSGLIELIKSLALIFVVSYLSYQVIVEYLPLYPRLVLMDARQLLHWTGLISYQVCLRVGIFLMVLALADFAFQRHQFLEQLKMSKQEVKDDFKETEGDPFTRGRIRRIQREMARKRMMTDVPQADVVITNPTHYAVALSYTMEEMDAPKVIAKGVGFLAIKIKELAREHDIPTVENRELAQMLYKTVDVGAFIPANLYKAVAEILAYIYKIRNKMRG